MAKGLQGGDAFIQFGQIHFFQRQGFSSICSMDEPQLSLSDTIASTVYTINHATSGVTVTRVFVTS